MSVKGNSVDLNSERKQDNWARAPRSRQLHLPQLQQQRALSELGKSDFLHLCGATLPVCTQPLCTSQQPPEQPQSCSSSIRRGWLQPRPRWSSPLCSSQNPWAFPTLPWITTPSWRRWWCSALRGPLFTLLPHLKVQVLALASQENSTTTLLEVRTSFILFI